MNRTDLSVATLLAAGTVLGFIFAYTYFELQGSPDPAFAGSFVGAILTSSTAITVIFIQRYVAQADVKDRTIRRIRNTLYAIERAISRPPAHLTAPYREDWSEAYKNKKTDSNLRNKTLMAIKASFATTLLDLEASCARIDQLENIDFLSDEALQSIDFLKDGLNILRTGYREGLRQIESDLALKNITEADVNRFIGMEIANYQSLESTINVIPIIKKYVS